MTGGKTPKCQVLFWSYESLCPLCMCSGSSLPAARALLRGHHHQSLVGHRINIHLLDRHERETLSPKLVPSSCLIAVMQKTMMPTAYHHGHRQGRIHREALAPLRSNDQHRTHRQGNNNYNLSNTNVVVVSMIASRPMYGINHWQQSRKERNWEIRILGWVRKLPAFSC